MVCAVGRGRAGAGFGALTGAFTGAGATLTGLWAATGAVMMAPLLPTKGTLPAPKGASSTAEGGEVVVAERDEGAALMSSEEKQELPTDERGELRKVETRDQCMSHERAYAYYLPAGAWRG